MGVSSVYNSVIVHLYSNTLRTYLMYEFFVK